jgi:hypothetical protein
MFLSKKKKPSPITINGMQYFDEQYKVLLDSVQRQLEAYGTLPDNRTLKEFLQDTEGRPGSLEFETRPPKFSRS